MNLANSQLAAISVLILSTVSFAQIGIPVAGPPPPMPYYAQPLCPGDGYIWTPGYWGWGDNYYWVPGMWVLPPEVGYLWTPGYWGWGGDAFLFNEGYWGLSVGFYGGIDYGFGYFGRGYEGGRWNNGHFFYNTSLNNLNRSDIRNVYNTRVSDSQTSRVSYNGGAGGVSARATSQEQAVAAGRHVSPVAAQTQHAQAARTDPEAARQSANSARSNASVHPKDLPAIERGTGAATGNTKQDQKNQKEQDKLVAKQTQDRQKLQQQQDKEHQQLAKQQTNDARNQAMEQRHQSQTQQMQQGHMQQMQQMQSRQQSGGGGGFRGGGGGARR
jgi:hypothetical protein